MRKYLSFLFLLCISIISCKKDSENKVADNNVHEIKFQVTGFTQTLQPFEVNSRNRTASLTTTALQDKVDVLYYLAYSNNKLYKKVKQVVRDADFGTITDKLPSGNYNIYFVAGKLDPKYVYNDYTKSDLVILNENELSTARFSYSNVIGDQSGNKKTLLNQDTFFNTIALTVNDATSINQSIKLNRVMGKLVVKIADPIPQYVDHVSITATNTYQTYLLSSGIPTHDTSSYMGININSFDFTTTQGVSAADKGTSNVTVGTLLTATISPMTIIIQCYDKNDLLLVQKTVANVTCQPNKITLLTGNMFTPSSGGGSNITFDPTWDSSTIEIPF